MEIGEWSLTLSPITPKTVRDAISAPFGHIVITSARLDPASVGDAGMLAIARYVGVCLRPGPQYNIGGPGQAWWLGDADRNGPITTTLANPGGTFQFVMSEYLDLQRAGATPITEGTIQALGGFYQKYVIHTTTREQIDALCVVYGAEWRINPDFTLDAGTAATVYGSTPVAVLVRNAGGRELALPGFEGDVAVTSDFSEYASHIVLLTGSGFGAATATSLLTPGFRDPNGNLVARDRIYDGSDLTEDQWQSTADALLAVHEVVDGRREVTLDSSSYDVRGTVFAGSQVYVYDLDLGLYDFTNEARYGGSTIWPQQVRVTRLTWPVEAGMGVYYRTATGVGTFVYTDLSDYVEYEAPGTSIEIVAGSAVGTATAGRPAPNATARALEEPWQTYTPTIAGTGFVLGNGTVVGGYRTAGSTVHLRGQLTIGSSTTVGTGAWTATLPTSMAAGSAQTQAGTASANNTGVARYHVGLVILASDTVMYFLNSAGAFIPNAGSTPFAWGTGDTLEWNATIELDT